MQKHIMDEKTNISYTLHGDYYLPDLELPEEKYEIGRFGRAHAKFMKNNRKAVYSELLFSGGLNEYLHDVDISAQEMFDRLVKLYADNQGVTEKLKAENQMEWVGRMNNIMSAAREVVNKELIYC